MARGITEQEVFEAADALLTRGERPTIDRVRHELGTDGVPRGSPNTVNPMLDTWWASLAARLRGAQAPGLPPSLLQACTRLYEELRRQVGADVEFQGQVQAREAQEAQRQLEHDRASLAAEKAGVLSTVEKLRGDLAGLREANQGLTRRNGQLESELTGSRQRTDDAVLQANQANEERERAAVAFRAELERVRDQWQGNERRWLGEIDHLRDEAKRFRSEHDRSQKALLGRIEDLEQQLSAGAKERASLKASLQVYETDLARTRESLRFAEGSLAAASASTQRPGKGRRVRGTQP